MTTCEWLSVVEPIAFAIGGVGGAFAFAWMVRGIFGGL